IVVPLILPLKNILEGLLGSTLLMEGLLAISSMAFIMSFLLHLLGKSVDFLIFPNLPPGSSFVNLTIKQCGLTTELPIISVAYFGWLIIPLKCPPITLLPVVFIPHKIFSRKAEFIL